jgi:DNA-binding MarR family transcriptional regulator
MLQSTAQRTAQGLAKIAMVMRHDAWSQAGPHGLTPTQAQVISLLTSRPKDSVTGLNDVAQALAITPATASDAVAALVRKGLVRKKQRGRRIALTLTTTGRQLARRLTEWPDFLLQAIDQLNEVEQAVFLRALIKMIRALQNDGRIPVQRMCVECRFFQPHAYPDPARPHHCHFVDAPFGDGGLMIHCPDHEPIDPASRDAVYQLFINGYPAAEKRGFVSTLLKGAEHE